ncbi:phage late control D family protein [Rhizobium sp. SSA_523]|uniref:phage late control D family protein n=1 Tax=Rhizobium sp. SSA_523 TaxID=2952477 RepID=UPI002091DC1B|nr:late control D family protein [Rhizobium sp. SSA_523]MCO5734141.1 late control D family protein [Rhizobium sp. SSA_523]WKC24778.1 late control D family protein [Rhizobium sp. SSA_523]
MPWSVDWKVLVDGVDLTSAMRPYLIKVTVSDKDGTASDSCSLEFDDSGGQVKLPAKGAAVQVFLQGVSVFVGKVDSVRSRGSRGGGRTLSVGAKGFDTKGKAKEPQSHHMDDATLQQFLDQVASKAGLKGITIDPAFASIRRDYWSASSESLLHLGQKLARELGGTFKIRGDQAVLAKRGQGLSPTGQPMPTVVGIAPPPGQKSGNVINWDIEPITGRAKFKKSKVRYFDRKTASFKEVEVEIGDDAEAADEARTAAADEGQAEAVAEGRKTDSEREGGQGSVTLDLEPTAQAEGTFVLTGARPGIDGVYRISGVTHQADRSGGSTTSLELKQPTGSAGKDDRKAGSGKSGASSSDTADAAGKDAEPAAAARTFDDFNRRYGRTDMN